MKKFKNIAQLKAKQTELKNRKVELEKIIRYDWKDIKSTAVDETISAGKSLLMNKLTDGVKKWFGEKYDNKE